MFRAEKVIKRKDFRAEKVIKRKGYKLQVKWKGSDSSFNGQIDKKGMMKMSVSFRKLKSFRRRVKIDQIYLIMQKKKSRFKKWCSYIKIY